jgi:hypothetical protein
VPYRGAIGNAGRVSYFSNTFCEQTLHESCAEAACRHIGMGLQFLCIFRKPPSGFRLISHANTANQNR